MHIDVMLLFPMPSYTYEYHGQQGIDAVQAPNSRQSFAAIVAAVANERIGPVHQGLVEAGVSTPSGLTDEITGSITFPLIGTDKDVSLIPVVHSVQRPHNVCDAFEAIDEELNVQIPVALRYTPLETDPRLSPHWLLLGGRHDEVKKVYVNKVSEIIRRVLNYDVIYPLRGLETPESPLDLRKLVRNSMSPFVLNAVGIDIIGHEHLERREQ